MSPSELEAATLRHIALDENIKAYVLQNQPLYQVLLRAAMRFIGGEILEQCERIAKTLNEQGYATTIDFMGESTRNTAVAEYAIQEFLTVIKTISIQKLNSSVSLDLSHIGMVIDPELAYKNATLLTQAAHNMGIEVMISMEGTDRTDMILELHQRLCYSFDNVGITLQAFLYRTPDDLALALKRPGKIRLVKGAYETPANLAMSRGPSLDATYCKLMETLLLSGHPCSIATHDATLLDHAHKLIKQQSIKKDVVEFEMLKGITQDRLQTMRGLGYRTRIYLPYGREWYLYLCNRLAEYPPNIYQAVVDAVTEGKSSVAVTKCLLPSETFTVG